MKENFTNLEKETQEELKYHFEFEGMFVPLQKYVDEKHWSDFMFMGYIVSERVFLYKHCITRCYLNIDFDGNFYKYTGNYETPYQKINKDIALRHVNL